MSRNIGAISVGVHGGRAIVSEAVAPDEQCAKASHHKALAVFEWIGCPQFEACESGQQASQCDAAFQSGQRRPYTMVDAVAEGEVTVGISGNIEPIGVMETPRVVIGRHQRDHHDMVLGNVRLTDADRRGSEPEDGDVGRSVEAQ